MTYAIVDIANFYVSSERVFDPRLRRVPVVVLSNNDGCAIARSEEAKALHIKMGEPFFKIRDIIKRHGIEVRSSNYELYADMNRRFNAVIAEHSDIVEIYSIDESFYRLPVLPNGLGDVAAAHRLREAIARTTGLPTRIGLGPTRALSKVANALAKATEKVWGGVVDLHDKELRARLFAEWPVHEVWGVAKALSVRLHPLGVRTAADLAALPPAVARDVGTVVLERLVRELNGIECDDFKPEPEASKATAVTRQFGAPVTDLAELREAMVRRAVRAAEKIRHQALMATRLIVFAHGSRYRPNPPSASRQTRLSPPSNDPRIIAGLAGKMMEAMYQPGGVYTKCGVLLEELVPEGAGQGDLFAVADPRAPALLAAMDGLNDRYGRGTVQLAAQGFGARGFDTKRSHKSPSWTTDINQIPIAR
ncbi:Y-family DNA polymerase [Sphingomonas sp. NPDC092331]|jgi:DNA polymerase V|uniref:DNA-directed DNA polymerase n=4 Tax=Sphingomonadaceae TaxID=41297 RepID=A0A401J8F3_SPHXE|nr:MULTISPECIES: Y-family DNA polymerase [Sphingomonadaceae]MBN8841657.1 Y-family DNA polymerase [Sphingomonadales bacterium]PZU71682.1 MAG: Y-family DNA polymerase [Rhizobium sp.]EQB16057.1 type VI secretion protein ImpB [Novosphingobium lindaniclasticum LE124]MBZ6384212.1 Y-family DNA polymerase [Sphingomonas sanguinis]NNG53772.1 Y-family DNA polymerase [Sphingomonas sanguinis]